MTDTLEVLADKQAITEVLYRYCRGLDRMDRAVARSVWHAAGIADYSPLFSGTADEFIDWVWQAHDALDRHSHQVTNILIDVDGDTATSESYVTVALRTKPTDGTAMEIESRGRYLDRWSRRDGMWAIDHRRFVEDLRRVHDAAPLEGAAIGASRRDPGDPSYALLDGAAARPRPVS
jgi:hypothetical protein